MHRLAPGMARVRTEKHGSLSRDRPTYLLLVAERGNVDAPHSLSACLRDETRRDIGSSTRRATMTVHPADARTS